MRIMAGFGGMGVIAVIAMFVRMIVVMPMIMPAVVIMSVRTMRRAGRRHRGSDRSDRAAALTQGSQETAALQEEQRHAEHLDKKIAQLFDGTLRPYRRVQGCSGYLEHRDVNKRQKQRHSRRLQRASLNSEQRADETPPLDEQESSPNPHDEQVAHDFDHIHGAVHGPRRCMQE